MKTAVNKQGGSDMVNYIGGVFKPSASGRTLESINPSTGAPYATLPDSQTEDAEDAISAAQTALPLWRALKTAERAEYLVKMADLMERRMNALAEAESRDQGKPITLARNMDMARSVHNFRHFARTALCDTEMAIPTEDHLHYTLIEPMGVVVVIVPWNLPLYLLTFKLAPALVYGNTVVAKPSEFTSMTAFMLAQIAHDVGLPPGVFNLILGLGPTLGKTLCTHPLVNAISFTGSTATGTYIASIAASTAKKVSLEMGGKNAAIVFPDADIDRTIAVLLRSCFINQGEVCLCTSRLYVHRDIYESFIEKLVKATRALKVGPPEKDGVFCGALVSQIHYNKVRTYIELGIQEGATIHCGGISLPGDLPKENEKGYFVAPTIMSGLEDNSRCMQEEIFGPVVCVSPFDSEAEVISRANGVIYGLCCSVFTNCASRQQRMARSIQAGTVWINCWLVRDLHMPFGGMKMSGIGREGTRDSKEFYTQTKSVCIQFNPQQ